MTPPLTDKYLPDKYHIARNTPSTTLTDFEPNLDRDRLCRYRLERVRAQLRAQNLSTFPFEEALLA